MPFCQLRPAMTALVSRLAVLLLGFLPAPVLAAGAIAGERLPGMTSHPAGIAALLIFVLAYVFVVFEEKLGLRKSKPVMVAAALIWLLIAIAAENNPSV